MVSQREGDPLNNFELQLLDEMEEKHWWFYERRNLLRNWARELNAKSRILDLGAGAGRQSQLLQEEFEYIVTAVEQSNFGREACLRKNVSVIQCDATKLLINDESFDAVIAMDVLEHIENDIVAMKELFRVAKNGANIFITVPAFQFLWSAHDVSVSHIRRYSKKEIQEKMLSAGFTLINVRYWNSILFLFAVILRALRKEGSDTKIPPAHINSLCKFIVRLESIIPLFGKLPGTSIVINAQKIL